MRYKIHEAAKMLGITPQTLRFYEQYGIKMDERVGEGKYRQYSDVSMDMLMSLRKCRNCGFTVAETAEVLREENLDVIADKLRRRAEALRRQALLDARTADILTKMAALAEPLKQSEITFSERLLPESLAEIMLTPDGAGLSSAQMERTAQWAEYMPMARWMFRISPKALSAGEAPERGFAMDIADARLLQVKETACMVRITPRPCLYTVLSWTPESGGALACIRRGALALAQKGYALAGPVHLFTMWNVDGRNGPASCGEFYFPIDP